AARGRARGGSCLFARGVADEHVVASLAAARLVGGDRLGRLLAPSLGAGLALRAARRSRLAARDAAAATLPTALVEVTAPPPLAHLAHAVLEAPPLRGPRRLVRGAAQAALFVAEAAGTLRGIAAASCGRVLEVAPEALEPALARVGAGAFGRCADVRFALPVQ